VELVNLECFVTLADELHFGRAAARLHVGTSALSKRIGELERRLGVRLFDRSSRGVRLTPAGESLLGQAQLALDDIAVLRAMAADAAAGAIGGIRAAYSPGTGETMTALARALRERSPGVAVHAEQMLSLRVTAAVRSRAVGIGIARVPPGPGLATMLIAESERNLVAMPSTHPLAERDYVTMADLANETLIEPSRTVIGDGNQILSVRSREADVSSEGELFDLVSSGLGVLVTSEGVIQRNPRHDIVAKPLDGSAGFSREFLLWRFDDDSPIRRTVCEIAEQIRPELARIALP
jgi:DNA-binding transcriptional LysR family regulator